MEAKRRQTQYTRIVDGLDELYVKSLLLHWGIEHVVRVSGYPKHLVYQWKPSRAPVPEDAALRLCEDAKDLGVFPETLRPDLPWNIVYRGRQRRAPGVNMGLLPTGLREIVSSVGVPRVALAAGRTRQNIYEITKPENNDKPCPVWLAMAIEQASGNRWLVEDLRPELPWYQLYNRHLDAHPVDIAA